MSIQSSAVAAVANAVTLKRHPPGATLTFTVCAACCRAADAENEDVSEWPSEGSIHISQTSSADLTLFTQWQLYVCVRVFDMDPCFVIQSNPTQAIPRVSDIKPQNVKSQ